MHSSSVFGLFTAGLACFAPLASAWTQPKGDAPEGNPLYTPGLNEVVPAGQPYSITWTPTTKGTVTLLLLKGPGGNAVPQYPIAEKIANSGKFSWTPPTTLAPGKTGYGIELIDDATGEYQFTTQFGISNPSYEQGSGSTGDSSSSSAGASASTSSAATSSSADSSSSSSSAAKSTESATTTSAVTTTLVKSHVTAPSASASGSGDGSSKVLTPTKPMTVPASLVTAATSTATLPVVTGQAHNGSATVSAPAGGNGAGQLATGFGGVFVAAAVVLLAF